MIDPPKFVLADDRNHRLPILSGFIPCFEEKTCQKTCSNGRGDSAGAGFEPSGEDADETVLVDCFLDSFCQIVTESGQGNGGTGAGKFGNWFIDAHSALKDTDYDIGYQNPCRSQLGFVDDDLTQQAE